MSKKVLICDDNPATHMSLAGYLEAEKMESIWARSGEEALEIAKREDIGLVILDIMLPGISGIETCLELRKTYKGAILMLSARGEETDRIVGLEVGADDYVTKPFSPKEVSIRARKLFSRYVGAEPDPERSIRIGNILILLERHEVFLNGRQMQLTPKEYKLLCYLADNPNVVRSRDQIINVVWGADFDGETRMVDILVTRLRKKLNESGAHISGVNIATVFGFGYKIEEDK